MNTLNHFRFIGVLTCCLLIGSFSSARAQEAAQAKLPATPSAAVLANWNDIGNRLITMAKDWPEDQYGYKLTPEVRSFSAVMLHIAGSNYDLLNGITKSKVGEGLSLIHISGSPKTPVHGAWLKCRATRGQRWCSPE